MCIRRIAILTNSVTGWSSLLYETRTHLLERAHNQKFGPRYQLSLWEEWSRGIAKTKVEIQPRYGSIREVATLERLINLCILIFCSVNFSYIVLKKKNIGKDFRNVLC